MYVFCFFFSFSATQLGYESNILSTKVSGEAREAAKWFVEEAKSIQQKLIEKMANQVCQENRPICMLAGGETTVNLATPHDESSIHERTSGLGGRNQEFVLAAALELIGTKSIVILSGGTDGTDGPSDAAGGLVCGETLVSSQEKIDQARESLRFHDSYHFLEQQGHDVLLKTGPTGTNVMDIMIALVDVPCID